MTAKDWSREIAAVSPFIRGFTVEVRGGCPRQLPGASKVVDGSVTGLASLGDSSADTLVCICGIEQEVDAITTLRSYRRILREGGNLVLVARVPSPSAAGPENRVSPEYLTGLLTLIGGLAVTKVEEAEPGDTVLVVAERSIVAEIRQPLGVHGPGIVQRVNTLPEARSEYYFQIGTLLLQTGDPEQASAFFEKVLTFEADNPEAYFGLGMTYGTQGRWADALQALNRSASLDPNNAEVQRWIQLARENTQSATAAPVGIPQVAPAAPRAQPAAPQQPGVVGNLQS